MPEGNYFNAPAKPDPANINASRDYDANTYLHELCKTGAPASLIREAIKAGADIEALNRNNMPPLGLAITRGNAEAAAALIDAGAKLYFEQEKKPGAFFNAAILATERGDRKMLETVLEKGGGAYVNLTGMDSAGFDDKFNALHIAIRKRNSGIIPVLIAAGAFPNAEAGAKKDTPLMSAIEANDGDAVARLVKQGASMEYAHSQTGDTPLIFACKNGHRTGATRLLALGADTQAVNKEGRTPLMLAAERGEVALVEDILKQGPDVNARSNNRETALMLGAKSGSAEVVKLLLKHGADPLLTDTFNKSARTYAETAPRRDYNNNSYGRGRSRYEGYDDDGYHPTSRGSSYNDNRSTASLVKALEDAEKNALQKQFEVSYNRFKKNPSGPGG